MSPFGKVQIQGHPKGPVFLGQDNWSGLDGTNLRCNLFNQQGFNQFRSECAQVV